MLDTQRVMEEKRDQGPLYSGQVNLRSLFFLLVVLSLAAVLFSTQPIRSYLHTIDIPIITANLSKAQRLMREFSSDDYGEEYLLSFRSPFIREEPLSYTGSKQNATCGPVGKPRQSKHVTWAWTPEWIPKTSSEKTFGHCPLKECTISFGLSSATLNSSHAIIFPTQSIRGPAPVRKHKDQIFIFYNLESPLNTRNDFFSTPWNSVFNWTMTYRIDSEIWNLYHYLKRVPDVPPLSHFIALAKNKSQIAAWFVSNCNSKNHRRSFTRDMQSQISVDVYGKCGTKKCARADKLKCQEMLTTKYFFYLSFENSHCRDYVTEKFTYTNFNKGIHVVPVVRGLADYDRYFPRGTFVNADWFEGPTQLAHFLKMLASDTVTYAKFLWRKAHFVEYERGLFDAYCQICSRLHCMDGTTGRQWHPDLHKWFSQCKTQGIP